MRLVFLLLVILNTTCQAETLDVSGILNMLIAVYLRPKYVNNKRGDVSHTKLEEISMELEMVL